MSSIIGEFFGPAPETIDTSPAIGDTVETTTSSRCGCRCGIRVDQRDGTIRHIEVNCDLPVNRRVLCAEGSAGIMQHYSPARLSKPPGGSRYPGWIDAMLSR